MTANSSALATAAQQRAHDTRHRAADILRRLDAAGETVTRFLGHLITRETV